MTATVQTLTLADARILIAAGEAKAVEIGVPYNIAVADAGGNLIAHVRMDGAWLGSIDISIGKAYSARAFDMSTDALSKASQSGQSLFGINTTNAGRIVIFGGGVPIKIGETVVARLAPVAVRSSRTSRSPKPPPPPSPANAFNH